MKLSFLFIAVLAVTAFAQAETKPPGKSKGGGAKKNEAALSDDNNIFENMQAVDDLSMTVQLIKDAKLESIISLLSGEGGAAVKEKKGGKQQKVRGGEEEEEREPTRKPAKVKGGEETEEREPRREPTRKPAKGKGGEEESAGAQNEDEETEEREPRREPVKKGKGETSPVKEKKGGKQEKVKTKEKGKQAKVKAGGAEPKAPFTVFAPSNKAWKDAGIKDFGDKLKNLSPEAKDMLENAMRYHIVNNQQIMVKELEPLKAIFPRTLLDDPELVKLGGEAQVLAIQQDTEGVNTILTGLDSDFTRGAAVPINKDHNDIQCANGVLSVVDGLIPIPGTLADQLARDVEVKGVPDVLLASAIAYYDSFENFTLILPSAKAMEEASEDLEGLSTEDLVKMFAARQIKGVFYSQDLAKMSELVAENDTRLAIRAEPESIEEVREERESEKREEEKRKSKTAKAKKAIGKGSEAVSAVVSEARRKAEAFLKKMGLLKQEKVEEKDKKEKKAEKEQKPSKGEEEEETAGAQRDEDRDADRDADAEEEPAVTPTKPVKEKKGGKQERLNEKKGGKQAKVKGGEVTVIRIEDARVVVNDILLKNGVLHIVDKVLGLPAGKGAVKEKRKGEKVTERKEKGKGEKVTERKEKGRGERIERSKTREGSR